MWYAVEQNLKQEKRTRIRPSNFPVKFGGAGGWLSNYEFKCKNATEKTNKDFGFGKTQTTISKSNFIVLRRGKMFLKIEITGNVFLAWRSCRTENKLKNKCLKLWIKLN